MRFHAGMFWQIKVLANAYDLVTENDYTICDISGIWFVKTYIYVFHAGIFHPYRSSCKCAYDLIPKNDCTICDMSGR